MKKMYWFIMILLITVLATNCKPGSATIKNKNTSTFTSNSINTEEEEPSLVPTSEINEDDIVQWRSKIGKTLYVWDGKDLTINLDNQKPLGLFSELSQYRYSQLKKDTDSRTCYESHFFRPSSVVKNIVTFEYERGFSCGAVTSITWGYGSLDLEKDGIFSFPFDELLDKSTKLKSKSISLTDFFGEDEILRSFLSNHKISSGISDLVKEGKSNGFPDTLDKFGVLMKKHRHEFFEGEVYLDSNNYLESFAFQSIENGSLRILISLTPISHSNQAAQEHIELLLPIPQKLRNALILADSGKEGFLRKDARDITGTGSATFEN